MNINWDAEKYTSDFSFVHQYGNDVLKLIDASPNSTVLDLGCGNGALSKTLQEMGYVVTGIDASKEQLDIARKDYPEITFLQSDATSFSLPEPVNVIFSNAVFHWIEKEKQPDMVNCVRQALKENGQFVFELGGYGNNRLIHSALAQTFLAHHYSYKMPFYFPSISEYAALLEKNGFQVRFATLFDRPTELKGENGLKDWLKMFVKTPFSVVGSEDEKETILNETVDSLRNDLYKDGLWYSDYVRLRMKAIKVS